MNASNSPLPFRPNVCMLVYNQSRRLFLGERNGKPGVWQFPQGGAEEGLSPEENVLRELEEELGAAAPLFKIRTQLKSRHEYEFEVVPEYARGKWRGQSQTFWLVEFLGTDLDIVLDRNEPEFMGWRWCTIEEVKALAEPKRVAGYLNPLKELDAIWGKLGV